MNNIPAIRENKNLTGIQIWVLNFLFRSAEKDVYQRDVEREFNIRRSTATELMKSLEGAGLIRRVPVAYDARLKKIELTDYAEEVRRQLQAQVERTEKQMTHGFTEQELDKFFEYVARFKQNLAQMEEQG